PTLYKGFVATGVLSAIAFYPVTSWLMDGVGGISGVNYYLTALIGLADDGAGGDHRLLYREEILSGPGDRQGVGHRARNQHHRRAGGVAPVARHAGPGHRRGDSRQLQARRPLRRGDRGRGDADDGGDRGGDRFVRSDHRQRRRDRRDGQHGGGGPRRHRSARRGREHHQGGDQRVCHRLRRAGGDRPLLGIYPVGLQRGNGDGLRPLRPAGPRRPLHRRPPSLSLRGFLDEGGGTGGRLDRGRGPAPVPGDQRDHGGDRQARLRPVRRHRHGGGDPEDDDPVADPGPGSAAGRGGARAEIARRGPGRKHRHRPLCGDLNDLGGGGVGQREEIHRSGELRRKEEPGAPGGGDRRYGRRSV